MILYHDLFAYGTAFIYIYAFFCLYISHLMKLRSRPSYS